MMGEFKFSEPSAVIQIELPDGRLIEGPRGSTLEEFLEILKPELDSELLAGIVNGELRELSYCLNTSVRVEPLPMSDSRGLVIYKRSLVYMMAACFEKLFPGFDLEVKHSINGGGILCSVEGPRTFTSKDRHALEKEMRTLAAADHPITREEIPLEEAKALFESKKQADKVELLNYRRKPYLVTYKLDDFRDYFYGYMVPSTGYLKYFRLEDAGRENQFLLRHPVTGSSMQIGALEKYKRMRPIFEEYSSWQKNLNIHMLSSINKAIDEGRIEDLILVSESLLDRQFTKAAEAIVKHRDKIKVVMIAGPSSSGKTTSSKRLSIELLTHGISPIPVEMDNFFLDRALTPRDENGEYDFETVYALNIPVFRDCIKRLIEGEEVQIPRFDFVSGKSLPGQVLQMKENQILIVEGIHGLNPLMHEGFDPENIYGIFVAPMTQINMDRYNRVSTLDVRLMRRIVRDFRDRGYSAAATIARWESVRAGERKFINPYQNNADMLINTSLVYEVSALRELADIALRMVPHGTPEFVEAKRLLSFLEWVRPLDLNLVPANSILSEFVGGSNLKDFITWR
ncbi:MAG: TGS domain-containing protein, partial [Anaerolineaceae bacterium]|nr:TGS domain-containing protein [Anaerolineaceae bacterium]